MMLGTFEVTARSYGTVLRHGLAALSDGTAKLPNVAVAPVSFPGIGQLRADGKGCDWLPANYVSAP